MHLQAPWRMSYLRSLEKPAEGLGVEDEGCFLCRAAEATPDQFQERLVLWHSARCTIVINRYPYAMGHLLISPRHHEAELTALSAEDAADMHVQTVRAIDLLKKVMNPQGFNVGINLGRAAGAGVPGHLHRHVVPRWNGDTNFVSVVGNVRIIPQAMDQLWNDLHAAMES